MNTQFRYIRHNVFGWIIHSKNLNAGESYLVNVTENTEASQLGNITLWTKGLIEGRNITGNVQVIPRTPGYSNINRGTAIAGTYEFTATEASEWWCINYIANKKQLPEVEILYIKKGDSNTYPAGKKIFLCSGSASVNNTLCEAPIALELTSGQQLLTALNTCYGFIFKENKT